MKRKIKNNILKTITYINVLLLLLGICMLDSTGPGYKISLSFITLSSLWLLPFTFINRDYMKRHFE